MGYNYGWLLVQPVLASLIIEEKRMIVCFVVLEQAWFSLVADGGAISGNNVCGYRVGMCHGV